MFWMLLLTLGNAFAGTLAGVTLPDTATVGGQTLVLNGLGLREKIGFDIYVGALYLPAKTSDAAAAIAQDAPKRITMHFVYAGITGGSYVTKDQVNEAFEESFAKQGATAQSANKTTLEGWMDDLHPGDEVVFDYVPGTGTSVTVKGVNKGTIAGADFMKTLWTVYLGPNPPTAALKSGLLGEK